MKKHLGRSTTRLSVLLVLLFILIPEVSSIIPQGTAITSSFIIPAQSGTVWKALNNDYISDDAFPRDIEFVNATHGWVLSQNTTGTRHGMILSTNDSGDSWNQQYYNASQRFEQIAVIDSETLWVTGIGGLFHTENGGLFWNRTNIGEENDFFYGIQFINSTHGWTASHTGMYKTTDRGQSWISVESWTFDDDWGRMIHFISPLEGWVIGYLGIYHTENGGDTWVKEVSNGGWALSFVSNTEAWAISDNWLAYMTDGETWIEQPLPRTSLLPTKPPYFSDILFLDADNGWIAGDESKVIYTPNGGRDWFSQEFPDDIRVMSIDFINVTHGWAVGWGGYIYRTTNGNSLGFRLWLGMTDPVFLSNVAVIAIVVILITGVFIYYRRRRKANRLVGLVLDSPSID